MTFRLHLRPGAALALFAGGFALIAVLVEGLGTLPGDRRALLDLHGVLGSMLQNSFVAVARWSNLGALSVVAAAALAGLLLARRTGAAICFALRLAGVWALNPVLKDLFDRPRPELWESPLAVSEFSFPSGHAANTAVLVGAIVLALPAGRHRVLASLAGAAALAVVALSQLALGVHYPSDILAGWLLAGSWMAGVQALVGRRFPAG